MSIPGIRLDIGDHSVEIVDTPENLGDRYMLRIEADPGGPGVEGDFPHIHPPLVEAVRRLQPGVARILMGPLAALGRLFGRHPDLAGRSRPRPRKRVLVLYTDRSDRGKVEVERVERRDDELSRDSCPRRLGRNP